MHFFIHTDNTAIATQASEDAYGPESTDLTKKYNVTSRFHLTGQTKAFACQDSIMIVQQSSVDSTLVNVILKPIEGLKIPFGSVKYYLYRGLLKSSFMAGEVIKPQTALDNSEFIKRFWIDWNNYKISAQKPTLADPTPQSFGYDNSLTSTLDIEEVYNNSNDAVQGLLVKEGEWIGDFGHAFKIGFEVILEADKLTLDLAYLRAEKYQIDVTGLSGLELRAKRELILSYIDPAAFFGLHYDNGISTALYDSNNKKTTQKKKQNDLYTSILNKFATKNRVYLDIRSEHGYSYNFYQNYGDTSGCNIKIGNSAVLPGEQIYGYNEWPISIIDAPLVTSASNNNIRVNLRIDDNTKPILFFENKGILGPNNSSRFIDDKGILNGTFTDWGKNLTFFFPNIGAGTSKSNVAYYLKLYYFRQVYNTNSPVSVLKKENKLDNIFGSLNMPRLKNNTVFQHLENSSLSFINGIFSTNEQFDYLARSGAYFDADRIVFYAEMIVPHKISGRFYQQNNGPTTLGGLTLKGNFNIMSFLARDIGITKFNIQETTAPSTYQKVDILDVFAYNGSPASEENIFVLGITQSEFKMLKKAPGLSDKHSKYIVFEDSSPIPAVDKDGKPFKKYRLRVQGINSEGNSAISSPSTAVFVYTSRGFVFSSKAFAEAEKLASSTTYKRNYEEKIGYENIEKSSGKRYEDFFIDQDSGMRTEVDGFINALNNISAEDVNAYLDIRTLVEDSARDIWDQAVSSVQANSNTTPDDRPLYWARNKMQVALKSHPYFKTNKNKDLDEFMRIFEEKSRNYTGVDFSSAPTGAKKILITGFDPFQLNPRKQGNINQQNPSGIIALALHDKTLTDTNEIKGFIQTAIIPVRYNDFDGGIIENLTSTNISQVDMLITLSMNGSLPFFDIERFATQHRGGFYDNMGVNIKWPGIGEYVGLYNWPFFIETTLPTQQLVQGPFNNPQIQLIFYDQSYGYYPAKDGLTEKMIENHPRNGGSNTNQNSFSSKGITKSVIEIGSGGDYLSNEIFYRVGRKRNEINLNKYTGHIHVPGMEYSGLTIIQTIDKIKEMIKLCFTNI